MIDLYTLINKEIWRFLSIWKQTLLPPLISVILYLLIFWKFIWDKIQIVEGINYIDFIFPGLLMMSVVMASYQNTSSSFFFNKFMNSIQELLVSPISNWKILVWFCIWWVLRWLIVWVLIFIVWIFMVDLNIQSYFYTFVFLFLSSLLFSLMWLLNGILAKKFDDIAIIPSFIITPLIYLWGVFYSTSLLSPIWQTISQANPILYMVNWLRYWFIWFTDVNLTLSMIILIIFIIIFTILNMYLLKKWHWIRS